MTTFSDDFNRADSTDLGANWVEVSGDWSIVSNQLSPGTAGGTVVLRAAVPMSSNDNYAQTTITATTAVSQGVWCRGDTTLNSGYLWRNNGTAWALFSVVAGSFVSIATYSAAAAVGDVIKVQAVGSTVKAFINGIERASVTNTAVATGLNVGLRCEANNLLRLDNFSAGDAVSVLVAGIAGESETAQNLGSSKTLSVGVASETESAQVISVSKVSALGTAQEAENAQNISGGKFSVIGTAAESENSQQLTGVKTGILGISNESEASQSLGGEKESVLGIASTFEYALPLVGTKTVDISPAVELNTALTLTPSSGGGTTPVAQSILNSIKKVLSLASDDPSFDVDVLMHINSVFSDLTQLGVGPDEGFEIMDSDVTWDTYVNSPAQSSVKSYMYLRLRMIFDPPSTGYALDAMQKQIERFEWRLNVEREGRLWRDPTIPTTV